MRKKQYYISKVLFNPFFLQNLCIILVLILNQLRWSKLIKPYNNTLILFLIFIFCYNIVFGFIVYNNIVSQKFNFDDDKNFTKINIFVFFIFGLEVLTGGKLPILHLIDGGYQKILDSSFGLPFIHGFFLTFISFLSIYHFTIYLSKKKLKYFVNVILLNIIVFLNMYRGLLFYNLLNYFFLYLMKKMFNSDKINVVRIISVVMCIFIVFGLMGNLRLGSSILESDILLKRGGASEKFIDSKIPKSLFWVYLYVTTPFQVFQINIDSDINRKSTLEDFINHNIIPDFISARTLDKEKMYFKEINGFNVGSMYIEPYIMNGFLGAYCIHIIFSFFILFLYKTNTNNMFNIILASTSLVCVLFTIFFNVIPHTSYIMQIFYCMLFRNYNNRRIVLK